MHVIYGFKELLVLFFLIEAVVGGVFIIASAKLFQEPGFVHQANAFDD